ncbi:tRNA (adenosine(37)-N6)-dimethylallyltransferase MiaA [Phytomonospora endophytica]|uniref:tRNA dimethylallyltransferase n=1 Tax=Phytomonospora endophytica TaxID=714109 RepID=A0A841FJB8_9ACTN|nr:tRNA (adenosine(37)-N6)-dimethylallyltransferase MiaA [Phytomonospora endophytica]MBB6033652.1 tRNA dimethylallyltransferase [Phytomonospora endophytica]GIG64832.1 tRNA dimethylallyltransferase [Phytomonospora endophytica]
MHANATLPGPVIALVGPTAAGKSALSLAVARAVGSGGGGEVVNADSMQLYRGMDIGTAKVTVAERESVPHHMLDIWDVTQTADVASYQQATRSTVVDILSRGRVPVLVGGSGLYVDAVLDEFEFPGTDPELRAALEAELAEHGPEVLHARLSERDPAAAAAILPSNGRRVVRALEVVELTGGFRAELPPEPVARYRSLRIGVDRDTAELDERIAARVGQMWEAGLVDEVRGLLPHGLAEGLTASRAIGYRQVLRFLAGECTEDEARDDTVRATRRFVRRQRSWFRRDKRVVWLDAARPDLTEAATGIIDQWEQERAR